MKERLIERVKRAIRNKRKQIVKCVIRVAVKRLDVLNNSVFMVYFWSADGVTTYHVLAERSYPDYHIYGTRVDVLKKVGGEKDD